MQRILWPDKGQRDDTSHTMLSVDIIRIIQGLIFKNIYKEQKVMTEIGHGVLVVPPSLTLRIVTFSGVFC